MFHNAFFGETFLVACNTPFMHPDVMNIELVFGPGLESTPIALVFVIFSGRFSDFGRRFWRI